MICLDKKYLGLKIKNARKTAKLSQEELAEKVGMTEKNISNIERGLQYPSLENFVKILELLNISLKEFGIDKDLSKNENKYKIELIKNIELMDDKKIKILLKFAESINEIL